MEFGREKLLRIAGTAIFMCIVIIIQMFISISILQVNINFVLIPIILGGILFGKTSGAMLGIVFGICVFIQCGTGVQQAFGTALFNLNPFYTFIANFIRGGLLGYFTALVYQVCNKRLKNTYLKYLITACAAPIINTGLFLGLLYLLFSGYVNELASNSGKNIIYYLFIGMTGINFIIELISSVILAPVIALPLKKTAEKYFN